MSLGIGAMLHVLGGGSPKDPKTYVGRKITAAKAENDELRLTFEDGVTIRVYDGGQSCCEHRYMVVEDDLGVLIGNTLVSIDVNEAATAKFYEAEPQDKYTENEAAFLDVKSSGGMVTFSFRNEHNGYYGGFALNVEEV